MWVRFLGPEDLLEEGMATHSSILAWKIPWTEEPGGIQSLGSQRVRHDWGTQHELLHFRSHNGRLLFDLGKPETLSERQHAESLSGLPTCSGWYFGGLSGSSFDLRPWLLLRGLLGIETQAHRVWESLSPWIHPYGFLGLIHMISNLSSPDARFGHVDIWYYIKQGFTNSGLLWVYFIYDLVCF